jgi:hypothetical protein
MAPRRGSNRKKSQRQKRQSSSLIPKPFNSKFTKQSLRKIPQILYKGIVALSVFVSLIVVIYPRLTIVPGSTIEKHNPFHTPFVLKNDGYWPISEIEFICALGEVNLRGQSQLSFMNLNVQIANNNIPYLGVSKQTSIPFKQIFSREIPIESANINVLVSYKLFLLPFWLNDTQQFKTDLNYQGELIWVPAE